jgi:hypothetical protein
MRGYYVEEKKGRKFPIRHSLTYWLATKNQDENQENEEA